MKIIKEVHGKERYDWRSEEITLSGKCEEGGSRPLKVFFFFISQGAAEFSCEWALRLL